MRLDAERAEDLRRAAVVCRSCANDAELPRHVRAAAAAECERIERALDEIAERELSAAAASEREERAREARADALKRHMQHVAVQVQQEGLAPMTQDACGDDSTLDQMAEQDRLSTRGTVRAWVLCSLFAASVYVFGSSVAADAPLPATFAAICALWCIWRGFRA